MSRTSVTSERSVAYVDPRARSRRLLNKVPQVTVLFWVVKILSTTVGETAADFLDSTLGLGLSATTALMTLLLAAVLIVQFSVRRHVPFVYWSAVVLIGVVGTLFSDNLVDGVGVGLWTASSIFGAALAVTFLAWHRCERTVSIHEIVTPRREAYYWLTILFTFALGTSTGDLVAEKLTVGHLPSVLVLGGVIAAVTAGFHLLRIDVLLAFWAAYVVTRPFGASMGAFLTAKPQDGGLGLGADGTSLLFLAVILACVSWFSIRQRRTDRELASA